MKKTLKNLDIRKIRKIIVVGTIVIIFSIGMAMIITDITTVKTVFAMGGEIIKEGAQFELQNIKEVIIEGAKFI